MVKSLKEPSSGPMSMVDEGWREGLEESLLMTTERMAWVPQAFWMVCEAKKRPLSSTAVGSKAPSCGVEESVEVEPTYLKRNMTP